jgi:hypothetical protein
MLDPGQTAVTFPVVLSLSNAQDVSKRQGHDRRDRRLTPAGTVPGPNQVSMNVLHVLVKRLLHVQPHVEASDLTSLDLLYCLTDVFGTAPGALLKSSWFCA